MLLALDATVPEGFVIDLPRSMCTITNCGNIEILMMIAVRPGERISRTITAGENIVVPLQCSTVIPVQQVDLPADREFIFEPYTTPVTLYTYMVDSNLSQILTTNYSFSSVVIPKSLQLDKLHDIEYKGCYHLEDDSLFLTSRSSIDTTKDVRSASIQEWMDRLTDYKISG